MEVKKCWMVFQDGKHGKRPQRKHESIQAAMTEASRLAALRDGQKFLVVEVIGCVHFTDELGLRVAEASELTVS